MAQTFEGGRARRLPAELAMLRVTNAKHRLPAVFGTGLLIFLALGVMIGAGIFSLAGIQAATMAGPAVIASFGIAALVCLLAALSYAELSSTIPAAGSAYTFTYVAFGEIWAWVVGWALVLELVVAAALVSRVWAAYLVATLEGFDVAVPSAFADHAQVDAGIGWVAAALVVILMLLVMFGTKLSGRVLATIVSVKLVAVVLVIAVGARHVDTDNYTPFVPDVVAGAGARGSVLQSILGGSGDAFGVMGIFTAAGVIVFAFIGFDLIATAAEDAHEPRRSVPRAMLAAIGIVTALYVAMAAVLVGLRPYQELGTDAPVSDALQGGRHGVGGGRHQRRRPARPDDRRARGAHRPEPGAVRDGTRRAAAAGAVPGRWRSRRPRPRRSSPASRPRCSPSIRAPPRGSSSSCSAPCSRSASARWASSRCAAPSRRSSAGSGCPWCRWSRACRCSRRCGCR